MEAQIRFRGISHDELFGNKIEVTLANGQIKLTKVPDVEKRVRPTRRDDDRGLPPLELPRAAMDNKCWACSECDASLDEFARFCPTCGTQLLAGPKLRDAGTRPKLPPSLASLPPHPQATEFITIAIWWATWQVYDELKDVLVKYLRSHKVGEEEIQAIIGWCKKQGGSTGAKEEKKSSMWRKIVRLFSRR